MMELIGILFLQAELMHVVLLTLVVQHIHSTSKQAKSVHHYQHYFIEMVALVHHILKTHELQHLHQLEK